MPFPRDGLVRVSGLPRGGCGFQGKWSILMLNVSGTMADSFLPKLGGNMSLRLECAVWWKALGKRCLL